MITQTEVRKLLLRYRDTVEKLKKLGIIKTANVVAGYGEYIAARKLRLKLQPTGNKGFDAVDKNGKKYEIKSRKANYANQPTIFKIKKERIKDFDYLVYTEFDDDWNLRYFLKIPRDKVKPSVTNSVSVSEELKKNYNMPNMCGRKNH